MGPGAAASCSISVPASTANLGAGFDALGMALDVRATVWLPDAAPRRGQRVDRHHPLAVAFAAAGGDGLPWVRAPIPAGRGWGFSGAMRVAGVVAAHVQRHGPAAEVPASELLDIAARLEGHAENAAASMFGGFVVAAGGRVIRVPTSLAPTVVMWVPETASTSTDQSRKTLPDKVPLGDAAFNIGRASLLVAALATGEVAALRTATEDRLHQAVRLGRVPSTAAALEAALAGPAWAAWLSGSGPSVAVLCDAADAAGIAAALPAGGRCTILAIASAGATVTAA